MMGTCTTGRFEDCLVTMKTKLDQIAQKETRREARNKGFEEERTSLEKLEKELAEIWWNWIN